MAQESPKLDQGDGPAIEQRLQKEQEHLHGRPSQDFRNRSNARWTMPSASRDTDQDVVEYFAANYLRC